MGSSSLGKLLAIGEDYPGEGSEPPERSFLGSWIAFEAQIDVSSSVQEMDSMFVFHQISQHTKLLQWKFHE